MTTVKISFVEGAYQVLPAYQTAGAAGMDLRARTAVSICPGGRVLVPTGIKLEIPEGFEGQIRPRSGLALKHGITVLNAPGTIDSDYRGEVGVILINIGPIVYRIKAGDRIAQLVIARYERVGLTMALGELTDTERGASGFGSTDPLGKCPECFQMTENGFRSHRLACSKK